MASKSTSQNNTGIRIAILALVLAGVLGAILLFSSGDSDQGASIADQESAQTPQESESERKARIKREKHEARLERIAAARAAKLKAAQEAGELDEYGRRPFDATDPSTWNDVIDPSKLPAGVDLNDPSTFPILEKAYQATLAQRAEDARIKAERDAKGSSSSRKYSNAARLKAEREAAAKAEAEKGPASGTLEVLVLNEKGEALKNIAVYAPITEALALEGGQVAFKGEERNLFLKSDENGIVTFDPAALGLSPDESWPAEARVVVQNSSYATIVRPFKTRDLQYKKNTLEVTLVPAVLVEVKVVDREGNPIPAATITMKQGEGRYESMGDAFAASSDLDGRFNLKVARDYRYVFSVSAKGFVPFTTKAFDFTRDERSVSVTLKEGRGVEGYITDGGQAVEGATIISETDGINTVSDSEGYFVLAGLKDRIRSNRIRMRATKEGYAPVVRSLLVNEQDLEVNMPEEGIISGVVTLNGSPVAGATVSGTINQEKKNYPLAAVLTNEEGLFEIKGIGQGNVRLSAHTDTGFFSPPAGIAGKAAVNQDGVELKLGEGAKVLGQVNAIFANGATGGLASTSVTVDGTPVGVSAADGSFAIAGLAAGTHMVALQGNAEVPDYLKPYNLLAISGGEATRYFTLPAPKKITSKLGEEAKAEFQLVEFVERTHREISLHFVLDQPEDIAGIEVVLTPAVASAPNGHKTKPLRFQINLKGGEHTQEALSLLEDVKYSALIVHPRIHRQTISAADIESVPHEGVLQIDLKRAASFRAYVKDSSGNGIVGVRATVTGIKGSSGRGTVSTDQHGYFEVGGLTGKDFTVRLFKNSYYEFRENKVLSEGASEVPTLTLFGANEIRVRVVSPSGVPQPGSRVWAVRPGSNDPKSRMQYFNLGETDGEGRKVVNFHWIRHYQVLAYKGSQIAFVNFDNLKEEPTREFDITLEPSQKITGKVVSASSGAPLSRTDIYATLEGGGPRSNNWFITRTKNNGTFSITVPLGMHSIVVRETRIYLESYHNGIQAGQTGVEIKAETKDKVEGNWAEFVGVSAPKNVTAGQEFTVTVTVNNKGSTAWTSGAKYRLGTQAPKDTRRWGPSRFELGHDVGPASTYTFTLTLKAPTKAGSYNLRFRMVQDGKEWFGDLSQNVRIKVDAAQAPELPPAEKE